MNLNQTDFLFIDCQTTGMRPSVGQILEFAWAYRNNLHSHLVRLPDGEEIPYRVREITGIDESEMAEAETLQEVFTLFRQTLAAAPAGLTAIIHYAQFERPFLLDLFAKFADGLSELPFEIICSHQLTKRLLPNLPSQNIRGAAGFFGENISMIQRAASHVTATQTIWRGLLTELEKKAVTTRAELTNWLESSPKAKATTYEYRIDRLKRLELPDRPGIYRMLAKSGEVLYVGKATSLKSRVNSYFRGKKGRDRRKLEMLAQVWDLRVTSCETPLEAAILESDEIKRYNPPYNVVLKRGKRHIVFYDRNFSTCRSEKSAATPIGPFRNHNWIEHLRLLERSLHQPHFEQVFFDSVEEPTLRAGFALFCERQNLEAADLGRVRSLLALGLKLARNFVEPEDEVEEEALEEDTELTATPFTPEEVAGKFERLLRRAGIEYRRSRQMTQLLNAEITLKLKTGPRRLQFRHGHLQVDGANDGPGDWDGLAIDDFDRMSILLSELNKYDHQINGV